ncbi:flavodoxin [Peribacillus frigoritolerans]|uniref:hypothetical protein n=1 Tax=Peribacillus frigoritolerans TaxID=450367 RepID=UPI003838BB86
MKVFIGYVSLSGNTEKMAININNRMKAVGCEVYMERLDTIEVDALKDFDLALLVYIHGILKMYRMKQTSFMKKLIKWTLLE